MLDKGDIEIDQNHFTSIQSTISIIHTKTENVYKRLLQTQINFQNIVKLSSQWRNMPMYTRDKNIKLITFNNQLIDMKNTRYAEIRDSSKRIQRFLKENLLLFHNVPLVNSNYGKLIF